MQNFEPLAALAGVGAVVYSPQLKPRECGFGVWEAHPNKEQVTKDGTVSLEWNGEYLAIGILDGKPYHMACCGVNETFTARECAEMLCALQNSNKPTRVVDHLGHEYVSRHTAASVQAELDKKAAQAAEK